MEMKFVTMGMQQMEMVVAVTAGLLSQTTSVLEEPQHQLTLEVNAQLAENPTLNLLLMIESLSAEMGEILMNCEMMEI
jgi:hypothetical protein